MQLVKHFLPRKHWSGQRWQDPSSRNDLCAYLNCNFRSFFEKKGAELPEKKDSFSFYSEEAGPVTILVKHFPGKREFLHLSGNLLRVPWLSYLLQAPSYFQTTSYLSLGITCELPTNDLWHYSPPTSKSKSSLESHLIRRFSSIIVTAHWSS